MSPSNEERSGADGDAPPTETHEPAAAGGGAHEPPEPPTVVRQPAPGGDAPKHTGRNVGAPLVILGLIAFIVWGIPILQGFHFGCNVLAGDKFREVRLGAWVANAPGWDVFACRAG